MTEARSPDFLWPYNRGKDSKPPIEPILETERMTLRPLTEDDLAFVATTL